MRHRPSHPHAHSTRLTLLEGVSCLPCTEVGPTSTGHAAGAPFFIASLMYLMYANLGERAAGEASAYTVFNEGMHALPGQLRQEDMERELMHQ